MSLNELLIKTLSDIAPTYPFELDENDGDARDVRRIVFNYDTVPVIFGDNRPILEKHLVQVHYFCPHDDNSLSIRKAIKKALVHADFTFPDETCVSTGGAEALEEEQHYCFECEYPIPLKED